MDFVTAWKATSIIMTGAFGILGLVKDFKNKETGRITNWGRVSLAGILISSGCGVIAQLKESSRQEQSREKTAQQTLALAQKTDQAVQHLERLLSPLPENPLFLIKFAASCNGEFHSFCSSIGRSHSPWPYSDSQLHKWPAGHPGPLVLNLEFFADHGGVQEFEQGVRRHGDLSVYIQGYLASGSLAVFRPEDTLYLDVSTSRREGFPPRVYSEVKTNGRIKGTVDLSGRTMFITSFVNNLADFTLHTFSIVLSPSQQIETDVSRFERVTVQGRQAYRYTFPDFK